MRPSITRVRLLPTNTVVSISTCVSRSAPSVVSVNDSPSRPMLRTRPQTVSGGTVSSRISQARRRWSVRFLLDGLYSTMQKSPAAAPRRRCSILSHGVSRSDRLMHAKSHVSGEPSTAPPEQAAVMPGITSTSRFGSCSQSSSSRLAMPYTPASPEDTTATVLPCLAASTAALQRKTSRVMPDSMRSLSEMRFSIKSRYRP